MAEVTFMNLSPIFRGKLDTNFRHSLDEDDFQDILSECGSLFKSLTGFQDFVISSIAQRNLTEKSNNSLEDGNIEKITHNQSFQDENIVSIKVNQHDNKPLQTDNPALNAQKSDAKPKKQRKRNKKNPKGRVEITDKVSNETIPNSVTPENGSERFNDPFTDTDDICAISRVSEAYNQLDENVVDNWESHLNYDSVTNDNSSDNHLIEDHKFDTTSPALETYHSQDEIIVHIDENQINHIAPNSVNVLAPYDPLIKGSKTSKHLQDENIVTDPCDPFTLQKSDAKPKKTRKRDQKKLSKESVNKNETGKICENLQDQQKTALPYNEMVPSSVPLENENLSNTDDFRAISPAIADNCDHPQGYDKVDFFSATTESDDDKNVINDENFDADDYTGSVQTCEELLFQMWSKVNANNVKVSGNFCGLCNYSTQIQQDWIKHLKKFDHHEKYSDVVEFSCEFCSLKLIIKEEEKHFIINSELHIGLDNKVKRFKDMDKDRHSEVSDDLPDNVNDQEHIDSKNVAPELDNQEINIETFLETLDTKTDYEIDEEIEETDSITLDKRFRTQCTRFQKGRFPEFGYCSYCLAFIFNRDEWIAHPSKHSRKNKTVKNNEGYTLKCPKMCCEIFCFEIEIGKKYIKQHWDISHGSKQLRYDDCEQENRGSIFLAKPDGAVEEYNGTKILTGFTNIWRHFYCLHCHNIIYGAKEWNEHMRSVKEKIQGHKLSCQNCQSQFFSLDLKTGRDYVNFHLKTTHKVKVLEAETPRNLMESTNENIKMHINFNPLIKDDKVFYYCTVCNLLLSHKKLKKFENHTLLHEFNQKGVRLKCSDCDSEIYSNDISIAQHHLQAHNKIHEIKIPLVESLVFSNTEVKKNPRQLEKENENLDKEKFISYLITYWSTENWKIDKKSVCVECLTLVCEKKFELHVATHTGKAIDILHCDFCYCNFFSFSSKSYYYLDLHISLCHHKYETTLPSNISKENIEIKEAFTPLTKFEKAYNFCTICGLILCQTAKRNRKFERHVEGHDSLKKGVCLNCKDCHSVIYSDDIVTAQHYLNSHAVVHIKEIKPLKSTAEIRPLLSIATAMEVKENDTISKEENFYISLTKFWSTNNWKTNRKSVCVECMTLVIEDQYESHVYLHTDRTFEFILGCNLCYCKFFSFSSRSYDYLDLHISFCHPEKIKTITASLEADQSNPNPLDKQISSIFFPLTIYERLYYYCTICCLVFAPSNKQKFEKHVKDHKFKNGVRLKCNGCDSEIYSNDKSIARHHLKAHAVVHTKKSPNENLIFKTPTEKPAAAKKVLPALKTDVTLKDSAPKTLKKTKNGKNFNISIQQKKVIYYCTVCGFLVPQFCKREFENHTAKHDSHIKGIHLKCNDCDSEIYSSDIITAEYYLREHVEIHKVDLSSKKIPKTEHQIEIHPNFYPLTENEGRGHYCILCNEHIKGRKQKSFDNHINKTHPLEKGVRLKCSDLFCDSWIFSNDIISAQHYLNAHGEVHKMNPLSLKFTQNMDEPNFDAQAELEDATKTRIFIGFVTACEQLKNNIVSEIYFCRQCNIFLTSKTNLENHIKRKHVEGLTCSCIYCKCEIYPNDDISFSYMEYHNDLCHSSIHKKTKPSIVEINTNNGCNQAFLDVVEKKSSRLVSSYQPNFDGVCLLCNLTFIDRFEWMDHLDTHIGAKEATCQKCCISCYGAEDDFKQCFEHPSHLDLDLNF